MERLQGAVKRLLRPVARLPATIRGGVGAPLARGWRRWWPAPASARRGSGPRKYRIKRTTGGSYLPPRSTAWQAEHTARTRLSLRNCCCGSPSVVCALWQLTQAPAFGSVACQRARLRWKCVLCSVVSVTSSEDLLALLCPASRRSAAQPTDDLPMQSPLCGQHRRPAWRRQARRLVFLTLSQVLRAN